MKPGNLVRYSYFPHEELHFSGMTGLVVSKPYIVEDQYGEMITVDVMWSEERRPSSGVNITWEYIDELEIVCQVIE